jgi:hypothetical protein
LQNNLHLSWQWVYVSKLQFLHHIILGRQSASFQKIMNTLKRSSSLDEGLPPSRKRLRLSLDHRSGDPVSSLGSRNVRVVARVRPLSKNEEDKKEVIAIMPPSSILVGNEGRNYEYDSVFGQDSSQSQVYEESGAKQAVCQDILQGFNCTILAYGQTGSGKTCKSDLETDDFQFFFLLINSAF